LRAYPPKDSFARPAPASSIFQRPRRFRGRLMAFWRELVHRRRAAKCQTRWTGFLGASRETELSLMITPGISLSGKHRSGLSWRRAFIGILGSRASPGSWSIASPLARLTAMSPFVPSLPPPRQYDPDYARAIYARRRPEEWIGGRPRVIFLRTLVQSNETNRADCHVMVRRRYVNAAALNALPFLPCSAGSGPALETVPGNRLACVGLM
jgi:hypothetical protein